MSKTMPISVRVPANLRWDCGSCGDCCRNFILGPVDPHIIEQLKNEAIETRWEPARQRPWFHTKTAPNGQEQYYLSPGEDGACIFLRDDQLCSIHATLGPEYKPTFCREYPYHGILDRNALTLTARADCSSFHETFDTGTPVEERAKEFAALSRPYGIQQFTSQQIVLVPGVGLPYSAWTGLEADMLDLLDPTPRTPEKSIAMLKTAIQEEVGGQWPDTDERRAAMIRSQLTQMLTAALQHGLAQPTPDDPNTRKMKRILEQSLDTLVQATPMMPTAPNPISSRSQSYFDIILRSNLMAKSVFSFGPISAGLGLHLFGTHLVRQMGSTHNGPLSPADLGPHYAPWVRFTHNGVVQRLLHQAQPALTELFLVTPAEYSNQ